MSDWIYVDLRGRDLKSAVEEMQRQVAQQVSLPQGISLSWSGQFEYLERATETMKLVIPFTLLIIFYPVVRDFRPDQRRVADYGYTTLCADRRRLAVVSARL
ncbi:hypothetical protein DZJ_07110 [Dickeya ananatis]